MALKEHPWVVLACEIDVCLDLKKNYLMHLQKRK